MAPRGPSAFDVLAHRKIPPGPGGATVNQHRDKLKGEAKERVGRAMKDKDLEREGKIEKSKGKAKEAVDDAAEKLKDAVTDDDEKKR